MRPFARLTTVVFVLVCLLALNFGPGRPLATSAQQPQADPEIPVRVFQDLLIAPSAGLGQPMGASLSADGTPDPKEVALNFVNGAAGNLSAAPDLDWAIETTEALDDATMVVRMRQFKQAIPVFGSWLTMQVRGDSVTSISGAYVPEVAAATKPVISPDEAFKLAHTALLNNPDLLHSDHAADADGANPFLKPVLAEQELVFFNPSLFELNAAPTALAYRMVLNAPDDSQSVTAIVDALDGKLRLVYTNHHTALNRVIRDANNMQTTAGSTCYTENGQVGTPSPDCVAAFQNTGATYNYFKNTHNRDSFDGNGATMTAVVRYGTVANAFWNGQLTAFGPGFATRDVVGHEWAHAVTQYTAGLIYQGQSGALNESFSDIFGAMIDRDDWLMGEDTPIGAIRDMANPPAKNQPDKVSTYNCTTGDNGGVHINSGIPNKLAYLMSDGGTFNGRTVTAIGRDATERIFYRALTGGLGPSATFADLNNALLAAAAALYGGQGSAQYANTQAAALAVELNQAPSCGGGGTATPDSFEPDNAAASASNITVGAAAQSHNFHQNGDQDWVKFNASAGSAYVIETSNLQTSADTVLTLFNANGAQLAINDDSGGTWASRIAWTATDDGLFFVRAANYGNSGGANRGYQLRVTGSGGSTGGDAFEPDNTQATAKPITVGGAAQAHTFHVAGDQDWAVFSAAADSTYVIETFNLGSSSDTVLRLYNAAGDEIAYNDDTPGSWASRIIWTAAAAGNYAVKVNHYSSSAAGAATSYNLRVLGSTATGDSYEPDNGVAAARAIVPGGAAQAHTFHIPGDQDWLAFDATTGNAYQIETSNLTGGNDTVLEVYAADGTTLLASNDDYGGLASRVSYAPASNQRLLVKVRHYSSYAGNPQMGYNVQVTSTAQANADNYEPDNDAAQAALVAPGSLDSPLRQDAHNLHVPGDQDWVKFNAVAGNAYIFETSNLGDRADTVLDLLNPGGTQVIATDDDGGAGLASRLVWTAPANATYFLRVRGFSQWIGGTDTGYSLSLATEGTASESDAYEPDNTAATASPINNADAAQEHNFHVAGDQDWVVFDATAGTEYTIFTSQLATRADTVLELYDDSGTSLLAYNDDYAGLASRIVWTATDAGSYRLKVRHYSSNTAGANTDYRLSLIGANDSYEPDNAPEEASPITVNSPTPQTHNFGVAGDHDWVNFAAEAGWIYTIWTGNLGTCSDTVLELYAADGTTRLAYNDDSSGLASRIVWSANETGDLYVKVRHFSSSSFGPCSGYELHVDGVANTGDDYEPDGTPQDASPIVVNAVAQDHNFHVAGDQDWVTFVSREATAYRISTTLQNTCGDTVLELFDANGLALAYNDDYGSLASRIDWNATGGQLFVRVRHYSSQRSGDCTAYGLQVTSTSQATDAFEPDNTAATARPITIDGAAQAHNFHAATDVDWVSFDAVADTTYTLWTFNLGAGADTVLDLYTDDGITRIAYDDDSGTGLASRIVWTPDATASYRLRVRPFGSSGGRENASYELRVATGNILAGERNTAASVVLSGVEAADAGQLRLSGALVQGTPQVGGEFTTLVQAQGSAESFKLDAEAKSEFLQLLAIQPLDANGTPLNMANFPDGPPWTAQGAGESALLFNAPWSATTAGPLVALRWRVIAQPDSKQLQLPISLVGRAADGTTWQGGVVTINLPIGGEAKIDTVSPSELTIEPTSYLSLGVSGLNGELPKVYLVDVASSAEQQVVEVSYAAGSESDLVGTIDGSYKPGDYKVRIELANGSGSISTQIVRILERGQVPSTPTPGPSDKDEFIFLPFVRR